MAEIGSADWKVIYADYPGMPTIRNWVKLESFLRKVAQSTRAIQNNNGAEIVGKV